jgi:UrcA family protein
MVAAAFIGVGLTGAATQSYAAPPDVTIKGRAIDPQTQRSVYFGDLNLAVRPAQRVLNGRIRQVASDLCWDLNGAYDNDVCTRDAVHSTDDQVASAIVRAKRMMAGLPVGPALAISMVVSSR